METKTFRSGIFVSYSHADIKWLDRLRKFLAPYDKNEALILWDDTKIRSGSNWEDEISRALGSARVAVLLVSSDFLASEYITKRELPEILRRSTVANFVLIWIPIRASLWESTPLRPVEAAWDPHRPLDSLPKPKQEQALLQISKQIVGAADINALGNVFQIIDNFEPQVRAFISGSPEPEGEPQHGLSAKQAKTTIELVEPGEKHVLITAQQLSELSEGDQQLIRAYEQNMKTLFERWTELKSKRIAENPAVRREARKSSEKVKRELCQELNGLLRFIESMGMSLRDHYQNVRFLCSKPG